MAASFSFVNSEHRRTGARDDSQRDCFTFRAQIYFVNSRIHCCIALTIYFSLCLARGVYGCVHSPRCAVCTPGQGDSRVPGIAIGSSVERKCFVYSGIPLNVLSDYLAVRNKFLIMFVMLTIVRWENSFGGSE